MEQADEQFMDRAIALAERGIYSAAPNPRVGCVIVRDGAVIGEGFHARAGEGHAEVNAIAAAGDVRGATVYVTLEPCSHTGKTPPCADALVAAGVSRVVVAMLDPNPLVAGSGNDRLRAAGIAVQTGVLESRARALNPGFIKRMEQALPLLRAKLAMSLDGRTAMASGESQWITGALARADVQRLRARSCAIVTGIETVLADDPALTVRSPELGLQQAAGIVIRQPLRVIVDSTLRIPLDAKVLAGPGKTLVVSAHEDFAVEQQLQERGVELVVLSTATGEVDLKALLELLAQRQCNEVMLEAGATLAGAFWQQGLVDLLTVYMAPTLMGSRGRPLMQLPFDNMAEQQRLHIDSITPVGDDWRIDARINHTAAGPE